MHYPVGLLTEDGEARLADLFTELRMITDHLTFVLSGTACCHPTQHHLPLARHPALGRVVSVGWVRCHFSRGSIRQCRVNELPLP